MSIDGSTLIYGGTLALGVGLVLAYALLLLWSPPPILTHPSELTYLSATNLKEPLSLPKLEDPASVELSIIVPAFNETERLPAMLDATVSYLEGEGWQNASTTHKSKVRTGKTSPSPNGNGNVSAKKRKQNGSKRTFEIIIVDDGSTDSTSSFALSLARTKYPNTDIKVVTLEKNIGKGGAVRHGMLHAGGERLLMADADGASRIEDLASLWSDMDGIVSKPATKNDRAVVVGSRAHLVQTEAVVKRSLLRNILMYGLHTILRIVGVGHIRDTQCGFKLFSRSAAQQIFPSQHLPTWIFDVELLLIAKALGIEVGEVPVEWHEVAGSKLNVVTASIQMLRDLVVVRVNMVVGRWKAGEGPGVTMVDGKGTKGE
ncbi:Alg5-prov protein [Ephemerocybe angulata]|uniref:dolichyl-phosphate beta-glucosyltransferase n=1 Tax=Ephemerocybe angulata TaxID=980116 RepID=A0A8H6IDH1_9AGAR|nr:Alg5-prov protein [Tulosesus angulatus]